MKNRIKRNIDMIHIFLVSFLTILSASSCVNKDISESCPSFKKRFQTNKTKKKEVVIIKKQEDGNRPKFYKESN